MKKIFIITLVLATLALSALGFAACDSCDHAQLEHFVAVEPGCETDGNIEYWLCRQCGKYFSDEGKTKIAYADIVVGQLGHDWKLIEAVDSTCYEPGNTFGQACSRCDMSTVQMVQPSHDMTHHDAVAATCTTLGTKEHWTCSREEGVYYANEKGTVKLTDITTPKLDHEMTHHEGTPATCTDSGVKEYWTCANDDGVYYANEEGSETYDDLVDPATGHKMIHIDLLDATCTQDGYIEHWFCANENGYYLDEQGNTKVDFDDVVISAIGHDWNEDEWLFDDTYHWYACNNGCEEQGNKVAHRWDNGEVVEEATTSAAGMKTYKCQDCEQTKDVVLPRLGTFSFEIIVENLYQGQDGGEVTFEYDGQMEGDFYIEGTVITVTITLNDGFGLGYVYLNDNEIAYPLATNGKYVLDIVIEDHVTLTVEFGKIITTNRPWNLRDGGGTNFAFPWEYYREDATIPGGGNGTAMLYVYDATGINAREHDFTADDVFFIRELYHDQALSWSVFNAEVNSALFNLMRQLPDEERQFKFTLALAIRLLPSEAMRATGYVASELILPTAVTINGVGYDMTVDYDYSDADLCAPSDAQFSINEQGTAFEFLRTTNPKGSVFTKYYAAYIEVEMKKGDEIHYFYIFNENGKMYIYSSLDKSGTGLACAGVNDAWCYVKDFNTWVNSEYPGANIDVIEWEFRTKIHVGENSAWLFDGEWSEVIKYGV